MYKLSFLVFKESKVFINHFFANMSIILYVPFLSVIISDYYNTILEAKFICLPGKLNYGRKLIKYGYFIYQIII